MCRSAVCASFSYATLMRTDLRQETSWERLRVRLTVKCKEARLGEPPVASTHVLMLALEQVRGAIRACLTEAVC